VCGVVWAGIVVVTGYELGIVAWGVGLVTGVAVCAATSERSGRVGLMVAGLAFAGLLLGKFLTVEWAMPGMVSQEFAKDEETLDMLLRGVVAEEITTDPELIEWLEEGEGRPPSDPELARKCKELDDQIRDRIAAMAKQEKVNRITTALLGNMSFAQRLLATNSLFDILWLCLAVGTAWKLGTGGGAK
jgi:hypothetical protein